ncbi:hypothetical protein RND71_035858 [Anisodus tanguticus]|uniref:RING-type E3 ubiquitin transferase n=1 Tax=Anisodus tanguticus TaxID=243964 RepID=A0AAE1UW78_9SOLA|nr:hypothetical protein RND71_035858 [Anisodus tanguticus]
MHGERNLACELSLYDIVSHLLDDMDVRDEENEDDDDVLKYLKLRTHHAPAKDGVHTEEKSVDVQSFVVPHNVGASPGQLLVALLCTSLNAAMGSGSYNTTADHEDFVRQYWHPYQTPDFQPHMPYYFSVDMALPSIVVNNHRRYYPVPYYELIEVTDPSESIETSGMLASQLTDQERNLAFERSLYDIVSHRLDGMDVRDEENEDEDHVLKYLKLRTHSAPAKEGVNPEVVADVESETCACAICQSEYEHEEDIGTLQCGHEYHVNCIKQWLLRKKDCPMCRASVLPSQEQIL